MPHRVHTILSILAEDHAPAALRPSILLAVDWPTVAEEGPATGDDNLRAADAANILAFGGKARDNLSPRVVVVLASIAARLATVATSITATGDKAMTAHASALWGAAAALASLSATPSTAEAFDRGVKIRAALGIMPGADILGALGILRETLSAPNGIGIMSAASMQAENLKLAREGRDRALAECAALREQLLDALGLETSLRTTAQLIAEVIESREQARAERDAAMVRRNQVRDELHKAIGERDATRIERDRALTENRGARDILRVPAGRDIMVGDFAAYASIRSSPIATERDSLRASLTVMEAEVARLQARENAKDKPRHPVLSKPMTMAEALPQPGDAVPWAEVEDGALYFDGCRGGGGAEFLARFDGRWSWLFDADDGDLVLLMKNGRGCDGQVQYMDNKAHGILVARNLGDDPEAWRTAMREWTANGNKP